MNEVAQGIEKEDIGAQDAGFDNWDDVDLSDVVDDGDSEEQTGTGEERGDADQQEPQENADQESADKAGNEAGDQSEKDQKFTLKHLDETREVGRDEVIALAQKGLDYDRIRQDRESARAESQRLAVYEEFLKELAAPNNMSVEDLIDATRANILAERDGIDPSIALERVKLARERKAIETERQVAAKQAEASRQQAADQERIKASMDRFIAAHPELKAEDIPRDVWDAFAAGKDLSDAYAVHEARSLRAALEAKDQEIEALKQNKNNQARSTGSQTSAGEQKDGLDWIDKDWYDGT